jgi:hypothetical protein
VTLAPHDPGFYALLVGFEWKIMSIYSSNPRVKFVLGYLAESAALRTAKSPSKTISVVECLDDVLRRLPIILQLDYSSLANQIQ